jgi:hypothetical protein
MKIHPVIIIPIIITLLYPHLIISFKNKSSKINKLSKSPKPFSKNSTLEKKKPIIKMLKSNSTIILPEIIPQINKSHSPNNTLNIVLNLKISMSTLKHNIKPG